MEITTVRDLLKFWPDDVTPKYLKNEIHVPCPFCPSENEHDVTEKNNIAFVGDDRFVIFTDTHMAYCRRCATSGRGRNGKGTFFLSDIASRLSATISSNFDTTTQVPHRNEPLTLLSDSDLIFSHAMVNREFWYKLGWSDDVINKFKLGLYEMYGSDGPVHIIPMEVRTVEENSSRKWFVEGRPDAERKASIPTKRLPGSSASYFWLIVTDPDDKSIALVEGAKDAISAFVIGYKNIVCTFGTTVWSLQKTRFLKDKGFERFFSFGDNDEAGNLLNQKAYVWGKKVGLETTAIKWTTDKKPGYDVSDLLLDLGSEGAKTYTQNFLAVPDTSEQTEVTRPTFIKDFREVDPYYEPTRPLLVTLDDIRGDGELSMRHFVNTFLTEYPSKRRRGRGVLGLLNAPPGSGKTHLMVEIAENVAIDSAERKDDEYAKLSQDYIETLQLVDSIKDPEEKEINVKLAASMKRRLDNFSRSSVLWSTQYKSGFTQSVDVPIEESLWFEFKARSPENCENYDVATTLGQYNHDVGAYCAVACPFRDRCKKTGYLAQEEQRRQKPITVIRHQHLRNAGMIGEYGDLVLIDESPLNIIDTPMIFSSVDFRPHITGWEMEIADGEMVHCINLLEQTLRVSIKSNADEPQQFEDGSPNTQYMISGSAFIKLLDKNISGVDNNYDIIKVLEKIDEKIISDVYQPSFINGNITSIQKRAMPFVYEALMRELDFYRNDSSNAVPSALHLVSGRLEVYQNDSLRVSSSTPVIVSDATAGLPELYQAAFSRELDIYSPKVRNPNAHITVIAGSDWTRGELEHRLGKQLRDRASRKAEYAEDVTGEKFYLHDIPTNPNLYDDNKLLKEYEDAIYSLVERHPSILVVVHKKVRDILEDVFRYKYPTANEKISWGHYGSLRGTNKFKSCSAVVLLGVPRVPYDVVWRKIQAWANLLRIESPIPYKFIYKPKPYDGHYEGHTYRTFENPFAQRFVDMVEEGESVQSMERIRPHASDDEKHIYIFASRPIGNYISNITRKNQVLNLYRSDSSINRVKDYIVKTVRSGGKIPSKREIMTAFRVGYDVYKEAVDLTKSEMQSTISTSTRKDI